MTVRKIAIATLFAIAGSSLSAQDEAPAAAAGSGYRSFSPADKWEIGIGGGGALVVGDLDPKIGFGGSVHVRKSLDHIFSLRGNFNYMAAGGERDNSGSVGKSEADLTWMSGSVHAVVSLNNFRFNKPYRRILINAFGGVGFHKFSTEYKNIYRRTGSGLGFTDGKLDPDPNAQIEGGGEVSFRINPKFNISLAHTVFAAFGQGADELDADENIGVTNTTYRDILHYPHLTLNFNIGKASKSGALKSEPLYWVNPLSAFQDAIAALEARPVYDPTDTDGDGIIDAIDQEKESPAGARVDTRGVTLDSDGDSVADYKDKEPYSPPGFKVDAMGVAQVPKEKILSEADVNRLIDAKLAGFKLPSSKGLVDWFLPMIHFDLDRYDVKKAEYEKLYHVATVLKQNPEIKVAVIGHTDQSASARYNNVLSYNRAKAAIDFLVSQHGIARDRLILNWGGEDTALVPTSRSNYLNRRVEFKVATNEKEMNRPDGPNAGRGGRFSGNKDAGY